MKVQQACYAALGSAGMEALEKTLGYARELGYYVLLDTSAAAAPATGEALAKSCFGGFTLGEKHLEPPLACDGLGILAYQGKRRHQAAFALSCQDKSLFLLARSANKSARRCRISSPATGWSTR